MPQLWTNLYNESKGALRQLPLVIRFMRPFLLPIFIVCILYVAYLISKDFAEIRIALAQISSLSMLCGFAFAVLGVAARGGYRFVLYEIAGYSREKLPFPIAAQSYAWGQLLRYIPGKIAGPATEVVLLEGYLSLGALFRITVFETVAMLLFSMFWLAASFLYLQTLPVLAVLCAACGACVTWMMHKYPFGLVGQKNAAERASNLTCLTAVAMLSAEWLFYYGVWFAISGAASFVLATVYGAATWASTFVFVAPAGLGIRELAFSELATHVVSNAKADLLAQALVLRILQTLADIALPLALLTGNRGIAHE